MGGMLAHIYWLMRRDDYVSITDRLWRWLGAPCHVFKYRNPASRTCIHCGLSQLYYVHMYAEGETPIGWEQQGFDPPQRLWCNG